jgi:predicted molibdopterin-dependent oxidoreductase YjgC
MHRERGAPASGLDVDAPAVAGHELMRDGQSQLRPPALGAWRCERVEQAREQGGRDRLPFHFPEARVNRLTTDAGDQVTGTGEYKVCAARIEPVAGERSAHEMPGSYAAAREPSPVG